MTPSPMYTFAVPVFKQMLLALKGVLAQASAHATAHSIEPDALLQARLYPDMFALTKQVQIAADFARGVSARLAGVEVPAQAGQEKSFADLDLLLTQTVSFLDGLNAAQFEGSESKEIVLRPGTPKEKSWSVKPIWPTMACRSSSFMSPPPMTSCDTTGSRLASVTTWARTDKDRRERRLSAGRALHAI